MADASKKSAARSSCMAMCREVGAATWTKSGRNRWMPADAIARPSLKQPKASFVVNKICYRTLVWLLLALPAFVQSARAQSVDDVGLWSAFFSQGKFSEASRDSNDRLRWWFDGHYRLFDDNDGFGQSIVRPGIGLDVGENSAIWAGYGWIRTSPISGVDIDEQRIWQQWTWSRSIDPFKFAARTRFEQRFVESADDTGLRLRQFIRGQKNLGPCSRFTFVLWDELFVALNDTDWGQRSGFDQNRIFVGVGMKKRHSSNWRLEIGYMNQTVNQRGPTDRSNHILAFNLFRSPAK